MLLKIVISVFICAQLGHAEDDKITYDRFTGKVATSELLKKYEASGTTSTCTLTVKPCDPNERSRVDGSCNHLEYPMKGTYFEPLRRLLPANYFNVFHARKAVDGSELLSPRVIRYALLGEGKASSLKFTQAVTGFGIFSFADIGSVHDIKFFLLNKTDCCTANGMQSEKCMPILLRDDDPVHQFTDIRCLNLTKPLTYTDYGCTDKIEPHPIARATGVFDLSGIYNFEDEGEEVIRSYEGGKLTAEVDEYGIVWPPSSSEAYCPGNQPGETTCFKNHPTPLLPITLLSLWFFRNHNYLAENLAEVNPCWDDNTLFYNARDINIAFFNRILVRGWLKALIGYDTLVKLDIITHEEKMRDTYDPSKVPQMSMEYEYVPRYFHIAQEGSANLYYPNGTFKEEYPIVDVTFRPGFVGENGNVRYLEQHFNRQSCRPMAPGVDPDMAQRGLGLVQNAVDTTASDLYKSRLLGMAPYIDYVYLHSGHRIETFEDLEYLITKENIEKLKRVYKHPLDIDLMAGCWVEEPIKGGDIPPTVAYVLTEQIKHSIDSDRHWYERPNRPFAYTKAQFNEIKKATLSLLMCNNAESISEIQPDAFHLISKENPLMPCSEIPNLDFSKWADPDCRRDSSSDHSPRHHPRSQDGREKCKSKW